MTSVKSLITLSRVSPSIRRLRIRKAHACSRVWPTVRCLKIVKCCVFKGLRCRDLREVLVDLLVVEYFTFELRHHLLAGDAIVMYFAILVELESMHLTANGLEQGATT